MNNNTDEGRSEFSDGMDYDSIDGSDSSGIL